MTKIVTMRTGDKRIEIELSKEDEAHLLQYAFNELISKGAIQVVKERDEYLLKIEVQGNG